jgi:hypothetical protein
MPLLLVDAQVEQDGSLLQVEPPFAFQPLGFVWPTTSVPSVVLSLETTLGETTVSIPSTYMVLLRSGPATASSLVGADLSNVYVTEFLSPLTLPNGSILSDRKNYFKVASVVSSVGQLPSLSTTATTIENYDPLLSQPGYWSFPAPPAGALPCACVVDPDQECGGVEHYISTIGIV